MIRDTDTVPAGVPSASIRNRYRRSPARSRSSRSSSTRWPAAVRNESGRGGSYGARKSRWAEYRRASSAGVGDRERPQLHVHARSIAEAPVDSAPDALARGVQGIRRAGDRARPARCRRRVRPRPRLRRRLRAARDGDRPRHAALVAGHRHGGRPWRERRRRRRRRPGPDRHRDALLRRRRVRLRGRPAGDGLAQPGRLQRDEDRAPRGDAGGIGHRPRQDQGAGARRAASAGRPGRRGVAARRVRRVPRPRADLRRRVGDPPAAPRARRLQRHGRPDDRPGARPAPGDRFGPQLRARRSLPQPRAQPAARGEPAVHHRPGAQRGRRPRHRLGRRRRPLLLHRRHRRVRPRRPHHGADRPDDARPPPGSDHRLRPARVVGGARRRARGGRDGAREPGRTRLHQGPHPQGGRRVRRRGLGPLLLPRLLLLRHRRRPGARHARARLARGQAALGAPAPVPRALLHLGRDQLDGVRRAAQAAAPEGALRPGRRPGVAPGRDLVRVPGLALQRAPLEHRAAAAPEPRGARCRHDAGAPGRGARAHPRG